MGSPIMIDVVKLGKMRSQITVEQTNDVLTFNGVSVTKIQVSTI